MLDQITAMHVFARVAALGNLSAAARALGISPNMATKHVGALENRLGVKLLHRTTRKVTLTEPGRRYLESVERILTELAEAEALITAERHEVTGTLRVNVPVSLGVRELAPLMPEFSRLYPALTVDMGFNDRMVDLVEEGWDMAIRIGHIHDQTLVARRLAPCRLQVAGSPAYLIERGTPKTVAELTSHNCLAYTLLSHTGPRQWMFGNDGTVVVPIKGNYLGSNGEALIEAAVAGQGLIYEPSFLLGEHLRSGKLVPLTLDHPPMELPGIFAIHPSNRRPPAKVRAFIDFIATRFGARLSGVGHRAQPG
ncbi:LysR family transcriptional regulator [Microvirga zambiensis]|uniref:LysR family transcriptional regulator n=1 Tax=Microvirga zambiensis TaxID=1402137 RepID=UPI00191FECD8|nr:LysR family transcriptional regulator [Microvirga zambiensis]